MKAGLANKTLIKALTKRIQSLINNSGLSTYIGRAVITYSKTKSLWLIIELNTRSMSNPAKLTQSSFVATLDACTAPYYSSINVMNGQTYIGIKLNDGLVLPKYIKLPDLDLTKIMFGIDRAHKPITTTWNKLGHLMVAGMSGSGKSVFLRSLTHQAIFHGHQLILVDGDQTTFSPFFNSGNLLTQIGGLNNAEEKLAIAVEIIDKRSELFLAYPLVGSLEDYNKQVSEDDRLLRVCVFIDEFNALISATGGTSGTLASLVKQLAWRGRKFGITLALSGQTFEKKIVGAVRDQLLTRICFKVVNSSISRIVLNKAGAENIEIPGRALTNYWGEIQTYFILPEDVFVDGKAIMSGLDKAVAMGVMKFYDGSMSFRNLQDLGYGRSQAKVIRSKFLMNGWARLSNPGRSSIFLNLNNEEVIAIIDDIQT